MQDGSCGIAMLRQADVRTAGATAEFARQVSQQSLGRAYAAFRRFSSLSKSKRSWAASASGRQPVICGKIV